MIANAEILHLSIQGYVDNDVLIKMLHLYDLLIIPGEIEKWLNSQ